MAQREKLSLFGNMASLRVVEIVLENKTMMIVQENKAISLIREENKRQEESLGVPPASCHGSKDACSWGYQRSDPCRRSLFSTPRHSLLK